jgi:hypothetical protein
VNALDELGGALDVLGRAFADRQILIRLEVTQFFSDVLSEVEKHFSDERTGIGAK